MLAKPKQRPDDSDELFSQSGRYTRTATPSSQMNFAVRPLDRDGFVPLYFQIQSALTEKIRSGELREGDPLASEWDLACAYKVSRGTARQALHELKASGYASSQRRRGTFVTKGKTGKHRTQLCGFTENILQRGMVPTSRVLEQEVVDANVELAESLEVELGAPVMRLCRLRLADAVPVTVEKTYIAVRTFPGIEQIDFVERSLYRTLREQFGVGIDWAVEAIESLPATREESDLLKIPVKTCVLSISKNTVAVDRRPIEVTISRCRTDLYRSLVCSPATIIHLGARTYEDE